MRGPRTKSLLKLRARVRAKTARLGGRSLSHIVTAVNRSLRGWHGYSQHSQADTFTSVDGQVRRRLRSVLPWRLEGRGKGIGPPIHAGRTSGLRAVGCCPWPRNTSGRGRS
jgi:RNA-directed DNA polymerase